MREPICSGSCGWGLLFFLYEALVTHVLDWGDGELEDSVISVMSVMSVMSQKR